MVVEEPEATLTAGEAVVIALAQLANPALGLEELLRLQPDVERLAKREGHHDPTDFFGDLVLELWSQLRCIPGKTINRPYVFQRARDRLRDYYRRGASRERKRSKRPENISSDSINACTVKQAFGSLTAAEHDCLVRKYLLGQCDAEIAESQGVSPSGVRSRTYRARRKLLAGIDNTMVQRPPASSEVSN